MFGNTTFRQFELLGEALLAAVAVAVPVVTVLIFALAQ
jgi:hypothetical protein